MKNIKNPFDFLAITCIVIAGVFEALQQALNTAPKVLEKLPWLNLNGEWNYLPLILISISALIWLLKQIGVITVSPQTKGTPSAIPTSLKLQFFPNSISPVHIHLENIYSWYALCTIFTAIDSTGTEFVKKQWSIYLVFDNPITLKQIIIDGNGAILPFVEVKDRGERHAIVVVSGDLGAAILNIKAVVQ